MQGEWGYCRRCERLEPVDDTGRLGRHRVSCYISTDCTGTGEEPSPVPDTETPRIEPGLQDNYEKAKAGWVDDEESPSMEPGQTS